MEWFLLIIYIYLGAMLGSFASAIIYRIKEGQSWVFNENRQAARSFCPHCHYSLTVKDLIPLFSWVFLRGKCGYCRRAISKKYFLIEVAFAFYGGGVFYLFGLELNAAFAFLLLPFVGAQLILFFQNKLISFQLCYIIMAVIIISVATLILN